MNAPRPTSELAAVAEAADNGSPWEWEGGYPQKIVRVGDVVLVADCYESPDAPSRFAQFIATFDPPTVRALVARVTDLEARHETYEALRETAALNYERARAAEAQVETLEAGRMDLARLSEEQLARAVAAEAQVAALTAEKQDWLTKGFLGPDDAKALRAQVAVLTRRPEWVTCDYQPEKRENDPGGGSCTQALAALSAQVAALTQERDRCEHEIDEMDSRRADEWERALAAEAALATTRQALAEIAHPSCGDHQRWAIARRALAATEDTA